MGLWSETFGGGNSFSESVANTFTPGDGYSYERGELVNDSTGRVMTEAEKTAAGVGGADNQKTNRAKYESSPRRSKAKQNPDGSSTDRPITGIQSLLPMLGGMALGPVGVAAGLTYNRYNVPQAKSQPTSSSNNAVPASGKPSSSNRPQLRPNTLTDAQLKAAREGGAESRIQGAFFKESTGSGVGAPVFKMNMFGNSYEINPKTGNSKLLEGQANAAGDEGGIAAVRPVGTQATAPTSIMPAISAESEFAKQPMVSPPAEWLIANGYADTNPSYDALVKYNTDLRAGVLTMSEGGRLGQMQMQMQMGQMPRRGGISGQMGGLQQYGAYLDNRYGDPEFDQKRMQFLRDVNQQEQQTFGGGGGGSGPSSGLGGKGGAGNPADRLTQPLNELTAATDNTQLIENGFDNNVDPIEQYVQSANASSAASSQAPTNSLYKGLSPVFGGAIGGARAALGMAEGGDVQFALGGNEKDLLNAMENVVRKDLANDGEFNPANISDEDKIVIAQFVQQYGVDAIPRLVKKIQDGSIDKTRERFASGKNGVVRGNGDGSGVDDMVPAQLKDGDATQDVLLADGEFVLRKDAYEALKDAGVNVDKINDAGPDAAKELRRLMPT
jgi:hypothetical protein